MPDLGQILKSIHNNKNDLFQEEGSDPQVVEKEYKKLAYVVNRCLSYFSDTIFYAQEMNMRSSLDGKPQYKFYLHGVTKRNRFARGMKADNPEHLEIVKEYYGFNTKKARKALQILSPEDIEYIQARLNKGGIGKRK
jgi:hypothetical protein